MQQGENIQKKINNNKIYFYKGDKELIGLKFIGADFTIYVKTKDIIEINSDSELYNYLNDIFTMQYDFGNNPLKDVKTASLFVFLFN